MYKIMLSLALFAGLHTVAYAQTAQDCIDQYEDLKGQFLAVTADFQPECSNAGNDSSLFVESEPGDLPLHCDPSVSGSGGWDHWHLEARAVVGKESFCTVMLRGLKGQEGCGTEEIRMPLPSNEAAHWKNYMRQECRVTAED